MRTTFALAGLLAASTCWAQQPTQNPPQPPAQSQATTAPQSQTITVPVGTRIPLTLTSPIIAKSTHPGDSVRAVTTFPVTVGSQVAIPVGTYFEGVIDSLKVRGPYDSTVKMHFTRVVFANGYAMPVNGANTEASAQSPSANPPVANGFAGAGGGKFALMGRSAITPPPTSQIGPSKGEILGIGLGITAATAVAFILLAHHHARYPTNAIVFDTGWQFDMVLETPLTLDLRSTSTAVVGANAP